MRQNLKKIFCFADKISVGIIFAFAIVTFLIRNVLLPMVADDYSYAFIWNGDDLGNITYGISGDFQRVHSFYDILVSQWSLYFTWSGRIIAESLVQIFMWFGKPFFNIANTIAFFILLLLIFKLANVNYKSITRLQLIWVLICMWICIPDLASTMIWLTGACNYLWMALLQLIFLIPYTLSFYSKLKIPSILMLPLGLLAGCSNEAGGFSTLILAILMIILLKKQDKLQNWEIPGLIAFIIGYLILMLAPGNLVRQSIEFPDYQYNIELLIAHIKGPFLKIIRNESILLIIIIYYFIKKNHQLNIDFKHFSFTSILKKFSMEDILILLFTISGLLVPIVMIFSPQFPLRSCFMSPIYLLIASVMAIKNIKLPKLNSAFVYTVVTVCLISIFTAIYSDYLINRQIQQRFELIEKQRYADLIIVPKLHSSRILDKFLGLRIYGSVLISSGDLNKNPTLGQNVLFSKYYNLKQIMTVDDEQR